ncbi:MAG TPA: NUDIX hydrolase [Dehalococcoidia bacterium]|nr:NUDIX hydrolase [Dehalococcoidia bacterium]
MSDRPSSPLRTERAVSAGGVVYRQSEVGLEVVICGRSDDGVWGLPKGTPNEGESLEDAAIREVGEETGLQVRIEEKIGVIDYWFANPGEGVRFHKWVHYYLMVPIGGSIDAHDWEYDIVEWVPVAEAVRRLTFKNDVSVVHKAEAMINRGKPADLSSR